MTKIIGIVFKITVIYFAMTYGLRQYRPGGFYEQNILFWIFLILPYSIGAEFLISEIVKGIFGKWLAKE